MINSNVAVSTQEAAVSTTTLTPEQLAEAAKIFASQQQEVREAAAVQASPIDQSSVDGVENEEILPTVDQLRNAFEAAMASEVYMGKAKRLQRLLEALKVPMSNDKDYNQFLNHAKKDLYAEAAQKAAEQNQPVVLPTDDEVKAEAKKRYDAKVQKQAEKAAKKNS